MIKQILVASAIVMAAAAFIQPAAAQHRHGGGGGGGGHAGASVHISAPRASAHGGGSARSHLVAQPHRSAQAHRSVQHHRAATHRAQTHHRAAQTRRSQARHASTNRHEKALVNKRQENARDRRQAAQAKDRREAAQTKEQRENARERRQTGQDRREAAQDRRSREARQNHQEARAAAAAARLHRQRAGEARNIRQARFASRYYRNGRHWRIAYRPYRWAWRHNWYVGFVPWYGAVFWPYAYADIFAYTFWPYGYAPGYWAYAYDDFFDGIFWGYGEPAGYGYAYASPPQGSSTRVTRTKTSAAVNVAAAQDLCKEPGNGITAWPFEEITDKVNLNDDQGRLLDEVKAAAKDAAEQFAKSCPQDPNVATTPPSRLDAMTARLFATLQAVQTVRPSLERFYASLSDQQKEAFNQIGPDETKIAARSGGKPETQGSTVGSAPRDQQAANCGDQKGLANLPIDRIAKMVKPTDEQQKQLQELSDATGHALDILQNACPDQVALTPPSRLEAMETRLKAMIEAANTVKPALDTFYASLNDEQKAHFNKLGREMRASND